MASLCVKTLAWLPGEADGEKNIRGVKFDIEIRQTNPPWRFIAQVYFYPEPHDLESRTIFCFTTRNRKYPPTGVGGVFYPLVFYPRKAPGVL